MKVLSLWQPWASLVAVEAKRVETRHWSAHRYRLVGERVAIYATKRTSELWLATEIEPFVRRLFEADRAGTLARIDGRLPLGAIVATAVIDRCSEMTAESCAALLKRDADEHAFGLYEPGRFAWVLREVERLAEPLVAGPDTYKTRQGIFDVPDALLGLTPATPAQGSLL